MAFKFQQHLREMERRASSGRPMKNRRPRSLLDRFANVSELRDAKNRVAEVRQQERERAARQIIQN